MDLQLRHPANPVPYVPVFASMSQPRLVAVGTANSDRSYSQLEVLDRFSIVDRRIRSTFLNGGIEKRFLTLPSMSAGGGPETESQRQLLEKHKSVGVAMGVRAIKACLTEVHAAPGDVRYLCCVTTTGLLTPGLSALISRELDLPRDCGRIDIVGMGCNAGLNGLTAVHHWSASNPGKLAVMVCVEVCSAAYVFDGLIGTSVVNSLFGDGAAAVALLSPIEQAPIGPKIKKFHSCLITESIDAMRFDWDDSHGKFNFFLDQNVPYVVGANAERVIENLLDGTGIRRSDIDHWIVHSGGKKVIDSVRINLGLSKDQVRHTTSVLSDFGNLSSGSFLFSYQRLLSEGKVSVGDLGILMTMGPGTTIETALIEW